MLPPRSSEAGIARHQAALDRAHAPKLLPGSAMRRDAHREFASVAPTPPRSRATPRPNFTSAATPRSGFGGFCSGPRSGGAPVGLRLRHTLTTRRRCRAPPAAPPADAGGRGCGAADPRARGSRRACSGAQGEGMARSARPRRRLGVEEPARAGGALALLHRARRRQLRHRGGGRDPRDDGGARRQGHQRAPARPHVRERRQGRLRLLIEARSSSS